MYTEDELLVRSKHHIIAAISQLQSSKTVLRQPPSYGPFPRCSHVETELIGIINKLFELSDYINRETTKEATKKEHITNGKDESKNKDL
jgi:hypothetical protein